MIFFQKNENAQFYSGFSMIFNKNIKMLIFIQVFKAFSNFRVSQIYKI